MRQGLLLILAVLVLASGAGAQDQKNPQGLSAKFAPEAEVAGEYILLRHLTKLSPETSQPYGQTVVWTAPPPGQVYTLTGEFLTYRLTQLGLGNLVEGAVLPPAILVRQTGAYLSREQVAAKVRRYVLEHTHWSENHIRIEIFPLEDPVILADQNFSLEVLPSKNGSLLGEVSLELMVMRQGQRPRRFKVICKVSLKRPVVCTTKLLRAQDKVEPGDVRLCLRDVTNLAREDFFVALDQVVGRILARGLGPEEIVTHRQLSHDPVINRGDEVTVVLDQDGLVISTKGVAQEPGYPGRVIRMVNPKSKKEFQAQVVDAKTVKVML